MTPTRGRGGPEGPPDPSAPQFAASTDVGRVRTNNEDAFLLAPPLFAVADGMGGHRAGEVASAEAIRTLGEEAGHDTDSLVAAVHAANRAVYARATGHPELAGMGTTMTAMLATANSVQIVHVGDSRAYRLRNGRLRMLTQDHTVVDRLAREGKITHEEVASHPQRSVLERALGVAPDVDVDAHLIDVHPGDRLLLCTDGLTSMLTDEEIEAVLRQEPDPTAASQRLVDEAVAAGGKDNVTTLVVDFPPDPSGAEDPNATSVFPPVQTLPPVEGWRAARVSGSAPGPPSGRSRAPASGPVSDQTQVLSTPIRSAQPSRPDAGGGPRARPGFTPPIPPMGSSPGPMGTSPGGGRAQTSRDQPPTGRDRGPAGTGDPPSAGSRERSPGLSRELPPPISDTRPAALTTRLFGSRGSSPGDVEVQPANRRRWSIGVRAAVWGSVVVVLVVIGLLALHLGVSSSWYVGQDDGHVAIFQGVPGSFAGIRMNSLVRTTPVKVASLPADYQRRIRQGITATGRSDAQRIATNLAQVEVVPPPAATFPTSTATPATPVSPNPTGATATGTAGATPGPSGIATGATP